VTTSTIPTAAKRKEIVRHGDRHCASWRTVGQTQVGVPVPSHHAGGESSHRLGWFVHGRPRRRQRRIVVQPERSKPLDWVGRSR
jgi:hypothetical protein